jgi:hypothetical protein
MTVERSAAAASDNDSLLNEPQLRHFEVFLSMLETALNEVERLTSPASVPGSENLVVYDSDLPQGFRKHAVPAIGAIRDQISDLAHKLGIEPQHRSRTRTAKALLTAELVRIDDSYARKLRGYGAVSPRVQIEIDPALDRIRTDIIALLQMAKQDTANKGHR